MWNIRFTFPHVGFGIIGSLVGRERDIRSVESKSLDGRIVVALNDFFPGFLAVGR